MRGWRSWRYRSSSRGRWPIFDATIAVIADDASAGAAPASEGPGSSRPATAASSARRRRRSGPPTSIVNDGTVEDLEGPASRALSAAGGGRGRAPRVRERVEPSALGRRSRSGRAPRRLQMIRRAFGLVVLRRRRGRRLALRLRRRAPGADAAPRHDDISASRPGKATPALIAAVIYKESRFEDQTSSAGARGLMQITPDTADTIESLPAARASSSRTWPIPSSTSATGRSISAT